MNRLYRHSGFRYVNEAAGAFVLLGALILASALFQSARVQRWFNPGRELRVILPQEGLFGLSAGSEVYVLGTEAGSVRDIDIDADGGRIVAHVLIRPQFADFIRVDSKARIKRKLAVTGDAYLDIERGDGKKLDWDLAVIEASTDSTTGDRINTMLANLEETAVPALTHFDEAVVAIRDLVRDVNDPEGDVRRLLRRARSVVAKVDEGRGTLGRLVEDDRVYEAALGAITRVRDTVDRIDPAVGRLNEAMADVAKFAGALGDRSEDLPEIVDRANGALTRLEEILADVRAASRELPKATRELPGIARDLAAATEALPGLVAQVRQAFREIERVAQKAQESWLLGGGSEKAARRPGPTEAQR